jgi:hypothetical protein
MPSRQRHRPGVPSTLLFLPRRRAPTHQETTMRLRALLPAVTLLLPLSQVLTAAPALALPSGAKVGIEARGRVDLDDLGPLPPISNLIEAEFAEPFVQSVVSVQDAQDGLFSYFSSADIGNLALKVSGSLSNTGGSTIGGGEIPVLQAVAEARDILVLTSTRTDPYDVTLELVVDGTLTTPAGSVAFASTLIRMNEAGKLSVADSGRYTGGPVNDVLSVSRTVSGAEVTIELASQMAYGVYRLAAGATASGDLSNTAHVRLILPEDVIISSSSSGTFGVPIVPIPEPSTMMLSAAGLLLLIAVARKKIRR